MALEVDRLKAEQEQLKAGLRDALGKYMGVEQTARGLVLNMGDIHFDVNKLTVKKDAELGLSKLSAERARTVADFLVAQGVAADRLTHAGYGPANQVGDNATAEGRAKNRRVELILNHGPVKATPGGMVAPEAPAKATKPAAKPAAAPAAK